MLVLSNRQVNYEKEIILADVMSENISKDPVELGVPQRLCLEDQVPIASDSSLNFIPKLYDEKEVK